MLSINSFHHIAIICSDYSKSKHFYTHVLPLEIIRETYRRERDSYKLDLALNGKFLIELFSFNNPPSRVTGPEAAGLRHLAFEVADMNEACRHLEEQGISYESVRTDTLTGKKFTFFRDPDDLPVEFYEQ